jgi:hypothetical protein
MDRHNNFAVISTYRLMNFLYQRIKKRHFLYYFILVLSMEFIYVEYNHSFAQALSPSLVDSSTVKKTIPIENTLNSQAIYKSSSFSRRYSQTYSQTWHIWSRFQSLNNKYDPLPRALFEEWDHSKQSFLRESRVAHHYQEGWFRAHQILSWQAIPTLLANQHPQYLYAFHEKNPFINVKTIVKANGSRAPSTLLPLPSYLTSTTDQFYLQSTHPVEIWIDGLLHYRIKKDHTWLTQKLIKVPKSYQQILLRFSAAIGVPQWRLTYLPDHIKRNDLEFIEQNETMDSDLKQWKIYTHKISHSKFVPITSLMKKTTKRIQLYNLLEHLPQDFNLDHVSLLREDWSLSYALPTRSNITLTRTFWIPYQLIEGKDHGTLQRDHITQTHHNNYDIPSNDTALLSKKVQTVTHTCKEGWQTLDSYTLSWHRGILYYLQQRCKSITDSWFDLWNIPYQLMTWSQAQWRFIIALPHIIDHQITLSDQTWYPFTGGLWYWQELKTLINDQSITWIWSPPQGKKGINSTTKDKSIPMIYWSAFHTWSSLSEHYMALLNLWSIPFRKALQRTYETEQLSIYQWSSSWLAWIKTQQGVYEITSPLRRIWGWDFKNKSKTKNEQYSLTHNTVQSLLAWCESIQNSLLIHYDLIANPLFPLHFMLAYPQANRLRSTQTPVPLHGQISHTSISKKTNAWWKIPSPIQIAMSQQKQQVKKYNSHINSKIDSKTDSKTGSKIGSKIHTTNDRIHRHSKYLNHRKQGVINEDLSKKIKFPIFILWSSAYKSYKQSASKLDSNTPIPQALTWIGYLDHQHIPRMLNHYALPDHSQWLPVYAKKRDQNLVKLNRYHHSPAPITIELKWSQLQLHTHTWHVQWHIENPTDSEAINPLQPHHLWSWQMNYGVPSITDHYLSNHGSFTAVPTQICAFNYKYNYKTSVKDMSYNVCNHLPLDNRWWPDQWSFIANHQWLKQDLLSTIKQEILMQDTFTHNTSQWQEALTILPQQNGVTLANLSKSWSIRSLRLPLMPTEIPTQWKTPAQNILLPTHAQLTRKIYLPRSYASHISQLKSIHINHPYLLYTLKIKPKVENSIVIEIIFQVRKSHFNPNEYTTWNQLVKRIHTLEKNFLTTY